ncbi:MAG: M15 family metallopeptidase, partial [Clostridia bacterium]|nr:M15 family metallopeptidase [Clostridia bacterium]
FRTGGGRSRRRRRQKMIKSLILSLVVILIVAGFIISLILIGRMGENSNGKDTETITETDPLPPETDPADTASGILSEGYITKTFTADEIHRGDLILVNSEYPYVFPEKTDLTDLYSGRKKYSDGSRAYQISTSDLKLDTFILSKLNEMNEDFYESTGERGLLIKSAYRTLDEQQSIYDYRVERDGEEEALKYVALPGASEHHTAMAFDMSVYKDGVNTYIEDEEEYLPIYENAHKYGFVLRYPESKADITGIAYEAWHFRYVGVPHAYYMHKNGLVLEEYLALLRENHMYNDPHLITECDNGNNYEIYYVPADASGQADIILPDGYEYTVSGDNMSGYIVTVKID